MNETDALFANRTPTAAAWQLALVLAHATECALATVEMLPTKAAKRDRDRHEAIAKTLVFHCADLNVPARGLMGSPCPRLAAKISQLRAATPKHDDAVI